MADDIPINAADEIAALKKENERLKKKIKGLEKTIEIASKHGDTMLICEKEASEEQFCKTIDLVPAPIVIATQAGGQIMYANQNACKTFRYLIEDIPKLKAAELYVHPENRQTFVDKVSIQGQIRDFEVEMKKSDGKLFWASLFSQTLIFKGEACLITIIYDLTERKQAEEEIQKLKKQLDRKEVKYLIFSIAGEEYGIDIRKIKNIEKMIPITPVPNMPEFIQGIINIRGQVIPITDLRLVFGKEGIKRDRMCIIIVELEEEKLIGMVVDSVIEVLSIRARDIEPCPEFWQSLNMEFVTGIAKVGNSVKILINIPSFFL